MAKRSILLLDPGSKLLYRYNFDTYNWKTEEAYTDKAAKDINNEIKTLDHLKAFELSGLTFKSPEANMYRNRILKENLIHPPACQYPSFTTFRELSSAFASVTSIKLSVDITRYVQELNSSLSSSLASELKNSFESSSESLRSSKSEILIDLYVSLVSTVNEAIEDLAYQLKKNFNFNLNPLNPKNQLTFKVQGRKEYFTGNYPMLAYRSVRSSLRGMENLPVNLTEVPIDLDMPPSPYVEDDEPLNSLYNFFMHYQDVNIPKYPINYSEIKQEKPRFELLQDFSPLQIRKEATIDLLKGTNLQNVAFSGECDWPFRIKICGIESLYNLFVEAFRGSATHNGTETPSYVVMPKLQEKKSEKKKDKRKSSSGLGNLERGDTVPLLKSKKHQKNKDEFPERSPYINQGGSNNLSKSLSDEFNLPFTPYMLKYDVRILYGEDVLNECGRRTEYSPFAYSSRIMQTITFPIKVSEIPLESRVAISVYAVSQNSESFLIGSCARPIFDCRGIMITGMHGLNLWPFYKIEERITCMQEFWGISTDYISEREYFGRGVSAYTHCAKVYVNFDSYSSKEIIWSRKDYSYLQKIYKCLAQPKKRQGILLRTRFRADSKFQYTSGDIGGDHEEEKEMKYVKSRPQIEELASLEKVLLKDPLETLSKEEKKLLFICREHYKSVPTALPLFLKSIDWTKPLQVEEAYKTLYKWGGVQPEDALVLLNSDYPDEYVRYYAVKKIAQLSDEDLTLYMLQLIQALTFENTHLSPLSQLILERALKNPHQIGHNLFWALRSQLHVKAVAERLGLILESFIMLCGSFREDLYKQVHFIEFYSDMSVRLSDADSFQEKERRLKILLEENLDKATNLCTLPVDNTLAISGPFVEKCKVMDSNKKPLWLTLQNSESSTTNIPIIFKTGDDLRQDIMSLQMIRIMDSIWLENGLDLRMKPYQVIATGDQSGIIEVVTNSDTTAKIHKDYGILGALRKEAFKDYMVKNNPGDEKFSKALDNFIRSCAGYCVATYILGIGDRHNGNIMMTKTGHLFHIDFGHFLGNFKTALGIQRERSKFVFTEEMSYAMGGLGSGGFEQFKDYSCKAYNYIRKHGRRVMHLFLFMVTAGMPELKKKSEIKYLREMLSLKLTEMEANNKFSDEITNSLNNTFRRIDNLFHNIRR